MEEKEQIKTDDLLVSNDYIMAVKHYKNNKGYKSLDDYLDADKDVDISRKNLLGAPEDMNTVLLSVDKMQKVMRILKTVRAESFVLYTTEDHPIMMVTNNNTEKYDVPEHTFITLAPRISEGGQESDKEGRIDLLEELIEEDKEEESGTEETQEEKEEEAEDAAEDSDDYDGLSDKEKVLQKIEEIDDGNGSDYPDVLKSLKKHGLEEDDIEDLINRLLKEGTIYEPMPGKFKKL